MLGVNENLAFIFHIDLLSPTAPNLYSHGLKLMDAITTVINKDGRVTMALEV